MGLAYASILTVTSCDAELGVKCDVKVSKASSKIAGKENGSRKPRSSGVQGSLPPEPPSPPLAAFAFRIGGALAGLPAKGLTLIVALVWN